MSIVKMKHVGLLAMTADREALLAVLQDLGCIQVAEPQDPSHVPSLARPDDRALGEAKEVFATVQSAYTILGRYGAPKGGLLTPRPMVSKEAFLAEETHEASVTLANQVASLERAMASHRSEMTKLQGQILSLSPWVSLDVPLESQSTGHVAVAFGTLPAQVDFAAMEEQVKEVTPLAQLTLAGKDRELQYFFLLSHKSVEGEVMEVVKDFGYSRAALRGFTGTAAHNTAVLEDKVASLTDEITALQEELKGLAPLAPQLAQAMDFTSQVISKEEAKGRLLDSASTFLLEGWVPEESVPDLEKALQNFDCGYALRDPEEEEIPQVPVKLKNNWFTGPLNMVTEMYSLPAYNGVDPNPLMAPFFILFYGIMMADMGYGLLMIAFSLLVTKKARPKGGTKNFMGLLWMCGVSTFFFGAITGGFFGDFIPQVLYITGLTPELISLPSLFTPINDTIAILIGALGIGMIQIFAGMAISMVRKFQKGDIGAAIKDEIAWYAIFACIAGFALTMNGIFGYAILVIIFGTQWIGGKGVVGKLLSIGGSLYNNVTGYFSDILSYARLMALMLSGAVVAQVFNTLGAIPGNLIIFIIISLLGNALNFALNLLGCYVHDLRLQCLEYFNRFYQDGGKAFQPLERNTKYVDLSDNI